MHTCVTWGLGFFCWWQCSHYGTCWFWDMAYLCHAWKGVTLCMSMMKNRQGKCWNKPSYWRRLDSFLGQGMSPSRWQCAASARLLLATATVAKLAFAIPECPKQLLVYLEHLLTRAISLETQDAQPQLIRQDKISSGAKAGRQTCSKSKAASKQGQCRKAEAKKRQTSKTCPQNMPPGK